MAGSARPRVLAIALAEATLDLIVPWAEAGSLPTFQRLMSEGSWGPLRSRVPLVTPQMWGTVVTGLNPGRHGAFDFWQRGPNGRFQEINGSWLKAKPIWQLLSERQVRCGIVNVPFTYPPSPINGFLIAGEDAPGAHRSIASPSALYDELVRTFGRYRLKDIFPGGRKKEDYLTLIEEDVAKQTDVIEYLLAQKPWDFFLAFSSATAIAQHYFWSDMESRDPQNPFRGIVQTAYRSLDTAIGRLWTVAGPDTRILVFSECGAGRLQSGVHINTWLEQEGFLERKARRNTREGGSSAAASRGSSRRLVARLRQTIQGTVPKSAYFWANKYGRGIKAWMQSYMADSDIAWTNTQAFSRGKEGDLFINLKGRDRHGVVRAGREYETVRDRLIERLAQLVDPATGQPAVDRVYRREELYHGPMIEWAPDLIIAWRDTMYQPTESDRDSHAVFVERWREYMDWPTSGGHRIDGMLFAAGPGICRGRRIDGASIVDLVPTWLTAMGQGIPPGLEGRPLASLFTGAPA